MLARKVRLPERTYEALSLGNGGKSRKGHISPKKPELKTENSTGNPRVLNSTVAESNTEISETSSSSATTSQTTSTVTSGKRFFKYLIHTVRPISGSVLTFNRFYTIY